MKQNQNIKIVLILLISLIRLGNIKISKEIHNKKEQKSIGINQSIK